MLAVLAFLGTAVIVVTRRTRGVQEQARVAELTVRLRELTAQKEFVERDLREASSWARIGPAAERRLGLRRAADSQIVTLTRGARVPADTDSP
jgi:hypothetical protein